VMEKANVEVVAGINLPMLIKLATSRDGNTLLEVAICAQKAGRKYINVASMLLAGRDTQ
jgi:PTS system mannose-specific IIA component